MSSPASSQRLPLLDALKATACVLIVLHHLAFYGPMSDRVMSLLPGLINGLYNHARLAVQIFLCISGFLAARALAPAGLLRVHQPLHLILQRHLRLSLPLAAALLICIPVSFLARQIADNAAIPDAPGVWQFISHLLLAHGITGQASLSAGVWYIAIDFQLFAGFVGLLWLAGKSRRPQQAGMLGLIAVTLASLLHFNRQAALDNWGLYFAGSYGLGVLAQWSSQQKQSGLWVAAIAGLGSLALIVDFRSRIAVSLAIALLLAWSCRNRLIEHWPETRLANWLSRISYALFLIHFPVCLLVNACAERWLPDSPLLNLAGMGVALGLSLATAHHFHARVEQVLDRWLRQAKGLPRDHFGLLAPMLRRAS